MESDGEMLSAAVKDRRWHALGDLRVLPDEILCTILTKLTPCDVARLSCVSRYDSQLFAFTWFSTSFLLLIAAIIE